MRLCAWVAISLKDEWVFSKYFTIQKDNFVRNTIFLWILMAIQDNTYSLWIFRSIIVHPRKRAIFDIISPVYTENVFTCRGIGLVPRSTPWDEKRKAVVSLLCWIHSLLFSVNCQFDLWTRNYESKIVASTLSSSGKFHDSSHDYILSSLITQERRTATPRTLDILPNAKYSRKCKG